MAKNITISLLKGKTTQNDNYTGVVGEVTVDEELNNLRLHDGETAGGVKILNETQVESLVTGGIEAALGDIEAALAAINGEI